MVSSSTHPPIHPFIHLPIHPCIFLPSTHPSITLLSTHAPIHPSILLSTHPPIYPTVPHGSITLLSTQPSFHPSIHPSIHLSTQPPPQPHVHPTAFSVSGFRLGAVRRTQGACGRICSGSPRLSVGPTVPVAPTLGFGNQERSFCCLHHRPPSCAPHPCPLLWGSPRCWREFAETS